MTVEGTTASVNNLGVTTAAANQLRSADTDVLRHCDLNDLSRTAVES